jgi:transposase
MVNEFIFDGSSQFLVIGIAKFEGKVIVDVVSIQNGSCCPKCNNYSFRVHSYYYRKMLDLPILGNETWIRLKARKFYCRSEKCRTRVFTERFHSSVSSKQRKTENVQDKVSRVALLMGGNGGEKICRLMNIPVSSSTLIRSIHKKPIPEVQALRVVGIDDWAYRKGSKYGTVLVDMEQRKIVDLLPGREAHTVAEWLNEYFGVR